MEVTGFPCHNGTDRQTAVLASQSGAEVLQVILHRSPVCWCRTDSGVSSSEMSLCPIRLADIFSDGDTRLRMVLYQGPGAQRWDSSPVTSGAVMWAPILSPS